MPFIVTERGVWYVLPYDVKECCVLAANVGYMVVDGVCDEAVGRNGGREVSDSNNGDCCVGDERQATLGELSQRAATSATLTCISAPSTRYR